MPRAGCPVESTRQWAATDRERRAPRSRQTGVVALHPTRPEPLRDARRDIRALFEGGMKGLERSTPDTESAPIYAHLQLGGRPSRRP
jgi:hypothetical protein